MEIPENQKELFSVNCAKDLPIAEQIVRALGVKINAVPEDLHVYINDKDIMEDVVLKTLLITVNKKSTTPATFK